MPVGRPPKPTSEKILNGNPGRRPLPADEPVATGTPIMPSWLDDSGRELWASVVVQLESMGVAREVDSAMLAGLCRWWSIWRAFDSKLTAGDDDWKTVCASAASWKQFSSIASKFGLNPTDRTRLKIEKQAVSKDDPLAAMMRKRAERQSRMPSTN